MDYHTILNFETCYKTFSGYLHNAYSLSYAQIGKMTKLKPMLYNEMKQMKTNKEMMTLSLKDYNNAILNSLKPKVIQEYKLVKVKKTNIANLDRDTNLFGNRPINTNDIVPINTNMTSEKEAINRTFENLLTSRGNESEQPDNMKLPAIEESKIELSEFNKIFADLESKRQDQFNLDIELQNKISDEPVQFYEQLQRDNEVANAKQTVALDTGHNKIEEIIQKPSKQIKHERYVLVNGSDRNVIHYKKRYSFQCEVANGKLRNITSIKFNKLILPFNKNIVPDIKTQEFGFSKNKHYLQSPYVMLKIDELYGIYEGSGDIARSCSCIFVHDGTFCCENDRGFTLYKPLQDEEKKFYPTPLSGLPYINLSVLKPNGTLINQSQDDYKISGISALSRNLNMDDTEWMHNSSICQPQQPRIANYLKITTNKYFPKTDFFIGDNIRFFNLKLVGPDDYNNNEFDEFMNRQEGHEIVDIGESNNESNFYSNEFYIFSPGYIDQNIGKLIMNEALIRAVENSSNVSGSIINASLQCSVAMKITTSENDASIIDVTNI